MLSNPSTLLDDHAMDHAQALLKAKYPNVNGLYATTSLALLSTLPEPPQGEVSDCSGLTYSSRQVDPIVDCLLLPTVLLSAATDHRARKSTSGPMQEV
ncbi:unnamed protein product [Boreogadus saida]